MVRPLLIDFLRLERIADLATEELTRLGMDAGRIASMRRFDGYALCVIMDCSFALLRTIPGHPDLGMSLMSRSQDFSGAVGRIQLRVSVFALACVCVCACIVEWFACDC